MGGINFAWLAVWVLSPDCPSCKQQVCNILGAWVKPPRLGEGSAGRAPTLHPIPWHLPYNWGKSRKTSVRVNWLYVCMSCCFYTCHWSSFH